MDSAVTERVRTRKNPDEVRAAVLTAARELFGRNGYSGTSLRDVAAGAGVNESVVFRNFGTKANLFRETVTGPLDDLVHHLFHEITPSDVARMGLDEAGQVFIGGLLDTLVSQKDLIRALLTAAAYEDDVASDLSEIAGLQKWFHDAAAMTTVIYAQNPDIVRHVTPELNARLSFGLVLTVALFGEWLIPQEYLADRDALVDQIAGFITYAMRDPADVIEPGRAPQPSAAPPKKTARRPRSR